MSELSRKLATEIIFGTQNEDTEYMTGACGNLCQKNHSAYNDIHQGDEYDPSVNGANAQNSKADLEYVKKLVGNKINAILNDDGCTKRDANAAYVKNAMYNEACSRLAEDTEYMKTAGSTQQDDPADDKYEGKTNEYDPAVNGAEGPQSPAMDEIKSLAGAEGVKIMTVSDAKRYAAQKLSEAAEVVKLVEILKEDTEYMTTSGTTQQDEPADDKVEGQTNAYDPAVNGANANNVKVGLDAIRDFIDAKALNLMTKTDGSAIVK